MSDSEADLHIRWQSGPAEQFAWSKLDDDAYAVYHRPSGKTHVMNAASVDLLTHVLTLPRSARAAAEELAAREGSVAEPEFFATIAESLRYLEHLGLIERCAS
jgi:PqqD family protein of HPr-rel-A system